MPQRFNRRNFLHLSLATTLSIATLSCLDSAAAPSLKLHPNRRFLLKPDGTPFFYLGDTAWELFHRLNQEEAALYLQDRAQKGFTVIQAVILAELGGLEQPNPEGHLPLINNDPTQPNEAYFQHVDQIVNQAAELGLFIGMLPTWGDKWNKKWGLGPEVFTPANARQFGAYLGKRYRHQPIIWILGGDRSPETDTHLQIIRAMAKGVRQGDRGAHLITFHPIGGTNSATWFHQDDWLDFNMFQSGHSAIDIANYQTTAANFALNPIKPTLDGEPCYEDHPINWNPENGWFDDFDVRQAAYRSMLSGACGHTYGNHNIWQMWQPDRGPIAYARTPWQQALAHPGATQMGYMRRLFESRPFTQLQPDQALVEGGGAENPIRAAVAIDRSFALVYLPQGQTVTIDLAKLATDRINAFWYDPRTGTATTIPTAATQFTPPTSGRGNDWLLVIDQAEQQFLTPGSTS